MKTFVVSPADHLRLSQDHRDIEELFEKVLQCAECDDRFELGRRWTEFEERLLAHMDGEQQFLLAGLMTTHPSEVQALREEHDAIRKLLAELDIETDLHAIRLRSLKELGQLLNDHAKKEDQTVYLWAEQELGSGPISALFEFLRERAASRRPRQKTN